MAVQPRTIIMFFLFPETSAASFFYNRVKRLRKASGDNRFKSKSEVDVAHHTTKDDLLILASVFILIFTEPIVLLMDLYGGLLYSVLFL